MAANFWASQHGAQLQTKDALQAAHAADRAKGVSAAQIDHLTNLHITYISDLAKCAASHGVRQRVAATACVFFRRFYLGNDFCTVDPRAVAPATLYLAAKVEEIHFQARYLFHAMQVVSGRYPGMLPELELKVLMDMEMALLEGLDYRLIVWHPYTDLAAFLGDACLTDIAQDCWAVLNDAYYTEVSLMFPPHIIALGCLNVAAALAQKDVRRWLDGFEVDLDQVYSVTQELTGMYDAMRQAPAISDTLQLLACLRS